MMVCKSNVREFVNRLHIETHYYWCRRFGIPPLKGHHYMSTAMMNQLNNCKDDESRRILLGVSR